MNNLVAAFVTTTTWDQLPPAVQNIAHLALLDAVGAMLVGTLADVSQITADYAQQRWPGDEATITLQGCRASAVGAAFANAYAANAIDIDDCGLYTKGHPGAQIVPVALALTEAHSLGGTDLLSAIVIGYEVAHRAARIWHATRDIYQACGSWGSVACAAIAARLMELDTRRTRQALGIADYHAPNLPMMRDIDHPTMVKHGVGWGAMNGIISAELAERGFTGIPSLLGIDRYRSWVSDLGTRYVVEEGIAWKRYACCAWDHAAILGADRLMKEYDIQAKDIRRVRVETFHETMRLGTKPPSTTEEAQFNLAWPLAAYIIDGEVGPDQVLEPALERGDIGDLARRIEVVETEELNRLYRLACQGDPRGTYASAVTMELADGRTVQTGPVEGEINFPQRTWDRQSLEGKFRWLTSHVLAKERVDQLIETISQVESLSDIGELTKLLA